MIRVTIEMVPGGAEDRKSIIGCMEIAKLGSASARAAGAYAVVLKKTPPFDGALRLAWRNGRIADLGSGCADVAADGEDDDLIVAITAGHKPPHRGVYDLLFRALVACGIEARNPPRKVPADLFAAAVPAP